MVYAPLVPLTLRWTPGSHGSCCGSPHSGALPVLVACYVRPCTKFPGTVGRWALPRIRSLQVARWVGLDWTKLYSCNCIIGAWAELSRSRGLLRVAVRLSVICQCGACRNSGVDSV
jgi:hypothetical protein